MSNRNQGEPRRPKRSARFSVGARRTRALLATVALLLGAPLASAQGQPAPPRPSQVSSDVTGRTLPADSITEHTLTLAGRTLKFHATAGALTLTDPAGHVAAELGTVTYTLDGAERSRRPVTFAINGGPGASSAYLQLGPLGPWRLPIGQGFNPGSISASQPIALVPNAETWLDFTDLVFIDPVDTGYSRATGSRDEIRDRYFTLDGDVSSLSAAIARWLRENERLSSPKFFVGESYGGFRGPLLARKLATEVGVGLSGMVLLSPVLDFATVSSADHAPEGFVAHLPSLAAAAAELKGPVNRDVLRDVERYAAGDYLLDLTRGLADAGAVERVSARVAALTGLDPALVRRANGRLDPSVFVRELRRRDGRVASLYDTGVTGLDPDPASPTSAASEPGLTALTAPLTSAIIDHLGRTLGWRVPNARYELLNGAVASAWRYGRGQRAPEVVDELKSALAFDGKLRVMVAHGLTDLVTPYFGSELILRQIPDYGGGKRLTLATYSGGHMFYTRPDSRAAFRADAQRLYEAALAARGD